MTSSAHGRLGLCPHDQWPSICGEKSCVDAWMAAHAPAWSEGRECCNRPEDECANLEQIRRLANEENAESGGSG